jgi:hypothetical protein
LGLLETQETTPNCVWDSTENSEEQKSRFREIRRINTTGCCAELAPKPGQTPHTVCQPCDVPRFGRHAGRRATVQPAVEKLVLSNITAI